MGRALAGFMVARNVTARSRLSRVALLLGTSWLLVSVFSNAVQGFSLWKHETVRNASPIDGTASASPTRRMMLGGVGTLSVLSPVAPALAYDTYNDPNLGYEFKYPTGLQKEDNKVFNVWLRDLIEPLESVGVKIVDTKRKSLDELGDANAVAKALMDDSIPAKAPRELIQAESKVDSSGRRYDVIEYRYQWKFDEATAQQVGRQRFQLHQKALITIDRRRQYTLFVAAEEDRWPVQGEGQLAAAIDTFKIIFD